jgi:phosphoribosylanthranilate isomerase
MNPEFPRVVAPSDYLRRRVRMSVLVKICGLNTAEGLEAALEAGADLVGFVFFPPSPRHLDGTRARALGRLVRGRARKVALTVDPDDVLLATVIEVLQPDMLQLHGSEPPERVAAVKAQFGLPVMKAIHVETSADLLMVPAYAEVADPLLFDARPPQDATRPGGLGNPFDWNLLQSLEPGVPFLLSGGLDAANVAKALKITRASGVDVSSGVERAPGQKDPDKIRAFIRAVREADANVAAGSRSTA